MSTQTGFPNILLIIADDLGADVVNFTTKSTVVGKGGPKVVRVMQVRTYDGTNDIYGDLPNISRFLRNGLYFSQTWAQPACSTTRASIYTGLHPWKNGVGSPKGAMLDSTKFQTLPTLLPTNYVSGLFGKWHLGDTSPYLPTEHGWDKHAGTFDNLEDVPTDLYMGYGDWTMVDSYKSYAETNITEYATMKTVQLAAEWINSQNPATPWFATIAFHSPHEPFHIPPDGYDTATAGAPVAGGTPTDEYMFNVMAQNMDYYIGRLIGTSSGGSTFKGINESQLLNTIIIFVSDNGSPEAVALEEAKMHIYEGSVRVPMIIADGQAVMNEFRGRAIKPRYQYVKRLNTTFPMLAHVVDLYATIARLADPAKVLPADIDSVSFRDVLIDGIAVPQPKRVYNFSQSYVDMPAVRLATIRNTGYKLNYDELDSPQWALYKYLGDEIPGLEDAAPGAVDAAEDLFIDPISAMDAADAAILYLLHAELTANYQADDDGTTFPDLPS